MVEGRAGEEGVEWGKGAVNVGGRAVVKGEEGLGESWLHCYGILIGYILGER